MSTNISVKLNVKNIDKARLYVGEKGTYLDATIIMRDEIDQYGNDGMIVQNVTKEEREQGIKGNILGNVKFIKKKVEEQKQQDADRLEVADDLPF